MATGMRPRSSRRFRRNQGEPARPGVQCRKHRAPGIRASSGPSEEQVCSRKDTTIMVVPCANMLAVSARM
jgi:hypothetical protein